MSLSAKGNADANIGSKSGTPPLDVAKTEEIKEMLRAAGPLIILFWK